MKKGDLVINRFRPKEMGVILTKNPTTNSYRVLWLKDSSQNWIPYLALELVKKCP